MSIPGKGTYIQISKFLVKIDEFDVKCLNLSDPMFVERKVHYSAFLTNLVRWHTGAVSFPLSDVILAQLACPLSDVLLCLHSGITNLSLYKQWYYLWAIHEH
jgi:hypothetical protein